MPYFCQKWKLFFSFLEKKGIAFPKVKHIMLHIAAAATGFSVSAPELSCSSFFSVGLLGYLYGIKSEVRHVWQDSLDDIIQFTKSHNGKRIYSWRKQTIERSFAEAKENHGLRYARMLGIRNMREQCFLTAAVQNIKRLIASLLSALVYFKPCILY